jgi:formylglycine-generating enzyme required for sulfatase activity
MITQVLRGWTYKLFGRRFGARPKKETKMSKQTLLKKRGQKRGKREDWIEIPAGKFLMGAQKLNPEEPNYDAEAENRESPVHPVILSAYRIGRYPVTVAEYLCFVEDGGYEEESYWKEGGFGKWKKPESWQEQVDHPARPVVKVSWYEASAYASWMAARRRVCGCRLPTEAEWERAARGTTGRKYPWGEDPPNERLANFVHGVGHPTHVWLYLLGKTPEGVLDMAGNVWEWCSDVFGGGYYGKSPKKDPKGPARSAGGGACVLRGGSWFSLSVYLRSAFRGGFLPVNRFDFIGFRVVCVLSPRTSL